MLKICSDSICLPSEIFKQALLTGLFPSEWKKRNIVPIHKKVTNKILKIIDQFLYFRFLVKFLKDLFLTKCLTISNKRISKNQSGFQPCDSCINQLLSITHEIFTSFASELEVRSVFLDIYLKLLI